MARTLPIALCVSILGAASLPVLAQTGSDFYAYPRTYNDFNAIKEEVRKLTFSRLPGISSDYKIGPGDRLSIEVAGLPALDLRLDVSNTGKINMPLLGSFTVSDLTAEELEYKIGSLLKEKNLLREPEVLVDISEYVAKPIYILGEIDKAGEYIMSQEWTLMDAILIAGGIDVTADRFGYLHRRLDGSEEPAVPSVTAPDARHTPVLNTLQRRPALPSIDNPAVAAPGTKVIRVDLSPVKKGGVLEQNITLKKGDVFIVPLRNTEFLYVIGEVRRPGGIDLSANEPVEPIRASRAIAMAGGPAPTAKLSKGVVIHYDATGKRTQRNVDFSAILEGKQPDFEVFPDDVIFIPGSKFKDMSYGLLGMIPQTVQQSIPTAPIRR